MSTEWKAVAVTASISLFIIFVFMWLVIFPVVGLLWLTGLIH